MEVPEDTYEWWTGDKVSHRDMSDLGKVRQRAATVIIKIIMMMMVMMMMMMMTITITMTTTL